MRVLESMADMPLSEEDHDDEVAEDREGDRFKSHFRRTGSMDTGARRRGHPGRGFGGVERDDGPGEEAAPNASGRGGEQS